MTALRRAVNGDRLKLRPADLSVLLPPQRTGWRRQRDGRHIKDVHARVCALVTPVGPLGRVLRLTALLHELDHRRAYRAGRKLADPKLAKQAAGLIARFGQGWRLEDHDDHMSFAARAGMLLRPYLLFELAHEGCPPPFMAGLWSYGRFGSLPKFSARARGNVRRKPAGR
jgi:hypothetical protein